MSSSLGDFSNAVTDVVSAVQASVVGVGPAGSGVVVGDGLVVTNAHNLRGEVTVTFADGRSATATVAGADLEGDLAVLSVDTAGTSAVTWSEGDVELGQVVVGLGRPGGRGLRAGVGFITGLGLSFRGPEGRTVSGALEHDRAVGPRLIGRACSRQRRPPRGHQYAPAGRGFLPRVTGRSRI